MSSFSFGSNQFLLPPELSNTVISCLTDPSDVSALMGSVTTSASSVRFMIDNVRIAEAAFACEASCFANNPNPDLQAGLGEMEIKPEPLRFIVCAGNDLLSDAAFPIEQWVLRKVSDSFGRAISNAIMIGDGIGRPLGILNPNAQIPICETSNLTPAGQFTWQDLLMLKYEIPMQWQAGCSYLMNQRTFALLQTMSDAIGRPLIVQNLTNGNGQFTYAGAPINIVTQMPDVAAGSIPIAIGNWRQTYLIVRRTGLTMVTDPFTMQFCTLFRFEMRIGGSVTCPNAARLLRIR